MAEDADPADPGTTEPTSDAPPGDAGDSTPGDEGDVEKTFSQKEVSDLVAREVAKAQRGRLSPKELGFDSGKDLEEFIQSSKTQADAAKTEHEKALEAAIATAQEEAKAEYLDIAGELVLKAEFLIAAKDNGVKYPHDAYELVQSLSEWDQVDINDDGAVVGIDKTLFDSLKSAKPFLFDVPVPPGDIGAGNRSGGGTSENDLLEKFPALKNFRGTTQ